MYSTSILSHEALGRNAEAFARPPQRLLDVEPEGVFRETISFSYTLARNGRTA